MGYQQIDVNNGYSFRTVTFKNITQTEFDLTDILPLHADGTPFGETFADRCAGNVTVRKIDAKGYYGTTYAYWSVGEEGAGWSTDDGETCIKPGVVKLKAGEGLIVWNDLADIDTDDPLAMKFQVSGEVDLSPRSVFGNGYSFGGNATPVEIDLTKIIPLRKDEGGNWVEFGETFADRCAGNVTVRKIDAKGYYGTTYAYWSVGEEGAGWSTDDGETCIKENTVKFAPGEGFILWNDLADIDTEDPLDVALRLPAPIK